MVVNAKDPAILGISFPDRCVEYAQSRNIHCPFGRDILLDRVETTLGFKRTNRCLAARDGEISDLRLIIRPLNRFHVSHTKRVARNRDTFANTNPVDRLLRPDRHGCNADDRDRQPDMGEQEAMRCPWQQLPASEKVRRRATARTKAQLAGIADRGANQQPDCQRHANRAQDMVPEYDNKHCDGCGCGKHHQDCALVTVPAVSAPCQQRTHGHEYNEQGHYRRERHVKVRRANRDLVPGQRVHEERIESTKKHGRRRTDQQNVIQDQPRLATFQGEIRAVRDPPGTQCIECQCAPCRQDKERENENAPPWIDGERMDTRQHT